MTKKCHQCKILTQNLCKNYIEEDIHKTIKEESHSDNFDIDHNLSDSEQETKVKHEPDFKPIVIGFYSEKERAQKKEKFKNLQHAKHNHKDNSFDEDILHGKNSEENAEKFKCSYCQCEYTTKKNLWRHIKTSHKDNMEEYAIKNQIKHSFKNEDMAKDSMECPYCDEIIIYKTGIGKYRLWCHIQSSHTEYAEEYAKKQSKKYFHCPDNECNLIFIHRRISSSKLLSL